MNILIQIFTPMNSIKETYAQLEKLENNSKFLGLGGIILILFGGMSAGGSYMYMQKLDGHSRSWTESFAPTIAGLSLIVFTIMVGIFIASVKAKIDPFRTVALTLVGGALAGLLLVFPLTWLVQWLDGDQTNKDGFLWLFWMSGMCGAILGAVWFLPCGGGFCEKKTKTDDDDGATNNPLVNWYDGMNHCMMGACNLAFVIRLGKKLDGENEESYLNIWTPYIVYWAWGIFGILVQLVVKLAFGKSRVHIALFLLYSIVTTVANVSTFILLPLYLDGNIIDGWKVATPYFVADGIMIFAGAILLLSFFGVITATKIGEENLNKVVSRLAGLLGTNAVNQANPQPDNPEQNAQVAVV